MRLTNTSRYPTDEVRALVEFGMRGVRTARLAVHVRNTSRGYRGRAYYGVPRISPRRDQKTVDRLVTLGIGNGPWPRTNMTTSTRYVAVSDEEYANLAPHERSQLAHWMRHDADGTERHGAKRVIVEAHPYGGKRSPLITMNDWREALVAVAAHEARHVWQFQHGKPRSEVDAERFAAKALARYREGRSA